MKILFDLGHPAHVHYFKNLIRHLNDNNHQCLILARDKEVTADLLRELNFSFIDKGEGGTAIIDRIEYMSHSLALIHSAINHFKPDLCVSHASPYLALAAKLHRLPHIMFNDTELATFFKQVAKWLGNDTYVPECFEKKQLKKLNFLPSYMELSYLHPEVFKPNQNVTKTLGSDYILLRFVSHSALHDYGSTEPGHSFKRKLVDSLKIFGNVWISSEEKLPDDLKKYRFPLSPGSIHDAIAGAKLVLGDSATMCTEAAVLGIPSIHIHRNRWGYIKELEEKYGLIMHFSEQYDDLDSALKAAQVILADADYKKENQERRKRMLSEKKNMSKLMVNIVEEKMGKIASKNFV